MAILAKLDPIHIDNIILAALKEDMPLGDITTENTVDPSTRSQAVLIAKDDAVLAGIDVFERVFTLLDDTNSMKFTRKANDGEHIKKGQTFLEFEGPASILLKGERTALNFLQHMSGIATKTNEFCQKVAHLSIQVTDTRKTVPGIRQLAKYAVRAGGGSNHRQCLSDGVLIKDNHIHAAGGIANAIAQVRGNIPHTIKIEVETENLDQVREALDSKADIIMLDNMSNEMMVEAVSLINKKALIEASGNVSLSNIYEIACTGVDIISVGELTHSVKAADISMKFV